jgi:hypothetical protein
MSGFSGPNRFGQVAIGAVVAPDSILTVNANTGASVAPTAGTSLHVIGADAANNALTMDAYAGGNIFHDKYAGGTQASKTAAINGTAIFTLTGLGWNTSAYVASTRISFVANETFSASANGGYISILTTPLTTTGVVEGARFQPSGGLSVGATAIAADPGVNNLNVSGAIFTKAPVTLTGTSGSVGA